MHEIKSTIKGVSHETFYPSFCLHGPLTDRLKQFCIGFRFREIIVFLQSTLTKLYLAHTSLPLPYLVSTSCSTPPPLPALPIYCLPLFCCSHLTNPCPP